MNHSEQPPCDGGTVKQLDKLSGPGPFPLAGGTQQRGAGLVDDGLEHPAVVAPIGDHDLRSVPVVVTPEPGGGAVGGQDRQQHLALVGLGAGQGESDRKPVQGRDQVQPQPPEEPGV